MEAFQQVLIISLYFLCPVLIGLILLQGGAGDVSSSFGGGGQLDSTLGVGANRKMAKLTTFLVILFMSMVLIAAIPVDGGLGGAGDAPKEETMEGTGDAPGMPPAVVPEDDADKAGDATGTDDAKDATDDAKGATDDAKGATDDAKDGTATEAGTDAKDAGDGTATGDGEADGPKVEIELEPEPDAAPQPE